ncbi:MAG: 2-oxoacid:ferredoxin oxidoreductase subunit gamma [Candidatus Zixiibacteriota bacterium]|nr:MAG: 2-oxoacid:ferredoxin oxidoreductase subunit gamma [candidate division Zixibacteria bacterium]
MAQYEVLWAGFGGQGIMVAGQLLAYTGIKEGKNVIWIPSYGPEMRGGTAYCTVVISDKRIGSPIMSAVHAACVFNRPSFDKFESKVRPKGLLLVNSSLINVTTERKDITEILVPSNQIATDAGGAKAANIAMLGAFVGATGLVDPDNLRETIKEKLGKKKNMLATNLKVLDLGLELGRKGVTRGRKK